MELPVEIDHATAAVVGRCASGDRQILNHTALARIQIELQGRVTEITLVIHPHLLVMDAFARVVFFGAAAH
ncbi:hypothetical protein D3C78_1756980 [compost metagenome]